MVSNSIITNPEAFVALRNLERTNESLSRTQQRISTGLKVSSAQDDASNFAIAQGIRGDVKALGAITQGLNNSKGIGNGLPSSILLEIVINSFLISPLSNKVVVFFLNTPV